MSAHSDTCVLIKCVLYLMPCYVSSTAGGGVQKTNPAGAPRERPRPAIGSGLCIRKRIAYDNGRYRGLYNLRSGVEGVISQAAYTLGMRRTRYRGSAKTIPSEYPSGTDGTMYRYGHGN